MSSVSLSDVQLANCVRFAKSCYYFSISFWGLVLDKHFITVGNEVQLIRVFEVKEGDGRVKVKYKNNRLCDPHRRPPLEASFGASMLLLNLTVGYDPSFIKRQMFWKYVPHIEVRGSVSSSY